MAEVTVTDRDMKVLEGVVALFADKERWIKGALATDALGDPGRDASEGDGAEVPPTSRKAEGFCLMGGIDHIAAQMTRAGKTRHEVREHLRLLLADEIAQADDDADPLDYDPANPDKGAVEDVISDFNDKDETGWRDIRKLLARAQRRARMLLGTLLRAKRPKKRVAAKKRGKPRVVRA